MSSFLGRGWKFPIQVDPVTGRIMMSEGEDDIAEAIRIILMTYQGERVMRPGFGGRLNDFVFGLTDPTTLGVLESDLRNAIMVWEPRVGKVEVQVQSDKSNPEQLWININYTVRSTNNLFNLVYPFYINEGTS
ncbi:MAG: baseplate protein [Firmicutes bacterium HGW-Firmicutes-15]|nr:MAG: baseplate protein [Firmicutes bacterium HGW-Firmicutes-15]